ncbi:hypothetical protein [Streptomyces sp. NPDC047024]|uniref:hypothetical protein n=1 Tax=Streptomyces sp. NPDC047024 TaxID=3155476 RepID=UPI0033D71176
MRVRVRFRFNAETGEVELFRVDDLGGSSVGADHDAEHDRISAELGAVAARRPEVEEIRQATPAGWPAPRAVHTETADDLAADTADDDGERETW